VLLARLPAPLTTAKLRAMRAMRATLGEPVEEHRFVADRINYGKEKRVADTFCDFLLCGIAVAGQ
jgi:hypothetical protein